MTLVRAWVVLWSQICTPFLVLVLAADNPALLISQLAGHPLCRLCMRARRQMLGVGGR